MIADGVDTFIEIGPGKALSGFMKKIDKTVKVFNVEDMASLEKTLAGLGIDVYKRQAYAHIRKDIRSCQKKKQLITGREARGGKAKV